VKLVDFKQYTATNISDAHTLADGSNPGGTSSSKLYCLATTCGSATIALPCQNTFTNTGTPYGSTTTFTTTGSLPNACAGDGGGGRMAYNSTYADSTTMAKDSMLMDIINGIENGDPFPVYDAQTRWALQYYVSSQNDSLNAATGYENAKAFAMADGAISAGDYATAQTLLNNVSPNNIIENNWQTVDNMVITKGANLDTGDVSSLQAIAIQCPQMGGNIVYNARAMLNNYYQRTITYNDNCGDNNDNRLASVNSAAIEKAQSIMVYPNPNNGSMTFSYKIKDDARLDISDLNGKLVGTYNLPAANYRFEVKNNNLKDGVYFYRISDAKNTVIKIGKIIVIQ